MVDQAFLPIGQHLLLRDTNGDINGERADLARCDDTLLLIETAFRGKADRGGSAGLARAADFIEKAPIAQRMAEQIAPEGIGRQDGAVLVYQYKDAVSTGSQRLEEPVRNFRFDGCDHDTAESAGFRLSDAPAEGQVEFRSAFFQQWHAHVQGAGRPLIGYRRLNLEKVRPFEELKWSREAVRVQAHATIGAGDQHIADLRNLPRDAAAFQLRQIVPIRPDAGG